MWATTQFSTNSRRWRCESFDCGERRQPGTEYNIDDRGGDHFDVRVCGRLLISQLTADDGAVNLSIVENDGNLERSTTSTTEVATTLMSVCVGDYSFLN